MQGATGAVNDLTSTAASETSIQKVKLIASFSEYSPRFDVIAVASRMVAAIPRSFLFGLDAIVFTNMGSRSGKRRRSKTKSRKRVVGIERAAGLYHAKWQGQPAWIEIFVDQTMHDSDRQWFFRIPFVRDILFSRVLFHEIGHHIHATSQPEFREKEDVADKWKSKLQRLYFRQQHPIAMRCAPLLIPFIKRYVAHGKRK